MVYEGVLVDDVKGWDICRFGVLVEILVVDDMYGGEV